MAGKPGCKKGFFSIISTFFLVIIIVFVLLSFIAFYSLLFGIRGGAIQNTERMSNAKIFKDNLFLCHGTPYLLEEKLNSDVCDSLSGVKGYKVIQKPFFGCEYKEFIKGVVDDPNSFKYPYRASVRQNDSDMSCLADLIVYVD